MSRLLPVFLPVFALLLASTCHAAEEASVWGSVEVAGNTVEPGQKGKFPFIKERGYEASYLNMPIFVAVGRTSGPTLCITAGIHGDETNSAEIARRVFAQADAGTMSGVLFMLPVVNADGFRSRTREMTDKRDLNRSFPGNPNGSVASIVANAVFKQLRQRCSALIDLHTGSNLRSNLPQIRVDLENQAARELAEHFGVGIVLGGAGPDGSLRSEIMKAGIPAIIYEAGGPLLFQEGEVQRGTLGITNAMVYLGMIPATGPAPEPPKIYARTKWVRVPVGQGGFFFPQKSMGDAVEAGTRLGIVVDPFTDEEHVISSPAAGHIIGMTLPQPVLSGYPLFHVGVD
jgi:predicted deacylase